MKHDLKDIDRKINNHYNALNQAHSLTNPHPLTRYPGGPMFRSLLDAELQALRRRDDFLAEARHAHLLRAATPPNSDPNHPHRPPPPPRPPCSTALDSTGLVLEHWGRTLRNLAAA